MSNKVLLLGFGYTAEVFARLLVNQGDSVIATSRQSSVRQRGRALGIKMIDFTAESIADEIVGVTHLVSSIPPQEHGSDPCLEMIAKHLGVLTESLQWMAYLSSTSVYGDHQGAWVNENSLCRPQPPRAKERHHCESGWLALYTEHQLPVHIFRLAGIYGPERNSLEKIRLGKKQTVVKLGQFFSRIHVDDIASALCASMKHSTPGEIYNLCDDEPAAIEEVDAFAAGLLDIKAPACIPFAEASLSPMARSFYLSNRRVSNAKIKQRLNFTPRYPSYREGLTALHKAIQESE